MKKKNQILSLLFASLLLASFLTVSCTDAETAKPEGKKDSAAIQTETTVPVETEKADVFHGVAEADLGGRTFNFYSEGWSNYDPLCVNDITADEITGEGLNDAVFNRNKTIQNAMNCKVTHERFTTHEEAFRTFRNAVTAGDAAYDIAIFRGTNFGTMLTNGYLCELSDLGNVDLSSPWWNPEFRASLTIGNQSYATISDITTSDEAAVFCVFFNKTMYDTYDFENLYNLVKDGKWTTEKMYEMGEEVSRDLNGDGKMDFEDQYGILYTRDFGMGLISSADIRIMEKNGEDIPALVFDTDRNITRYINAISPLYDTNNCYNFFQRGGFSQDCDGFTSGHMLFYLNGFYHAQAMREMDTDFGIVPYPKYDEAQEQYVNSASADYITLCGIPITNTDLEQTGIFMDYYAYLGRTMIRPEYYDGLLSGKLTRDNESNEMLDLIFDHVTIDAGVVFNFGSFSWDLMMKFDSGKTDDIISFTEKYKSKIEMDIKEWMEQVEQNQN